MTLLLIPNSVLISDRYCGTIMAGNSKFQFISFRAPIAFFSLTACAGLHLISLEQAKVFTIFVLPLNSCCNPFLYAILTKQFKKDCVTICKVSIFELFETI